MSTVNKKSPLKAPPLRLPGQSVQDEIDKLIDDSMVPTAMMAMFLAILAGYNWWFWYIKQIPSPIISSSAALIFIGLATWKITRGRKKLKILKLARDGERAVAQFLERLRAQGYDVYHDIVGENFNVDHVVIGPGGVFTIETKTNSKPAKGKSEIHYNGEHLMVNGFSPDRDPIIQAKAQAHWIKETLKESTGKTPPVRPVVVYPGWFVEKPKGLNPEVWVLNPKALPAYLENARSTISPEDKQLFSYHLSRHIRPTV